MEEKKVKLYGTWASPFSKRVEIGLKMKAVEFEFVEEDLRNKSPDLLRYNPAHKKIPVLVHGDKPIVESQVIIEYIDETWDHGTCILPCDPYERAVARFWAKFIDDKLMPSLLKSLWLGEEEAMGEALESMKVLDKELEGKRFFGGEGIGFADIMANFVGYWMGIVEEEIGKVMLTQETFPSLWKWKHEFVKCQVVQEILPPQDKLASYLKARIEETRGLASK